MSIPANCRPAAEQDPRLVSLLRDVAISILGQSLKWRGACRVRSRGAVPATIPFVSHLSSSYQCHPGHRLLSFCCCDTGVRRECIAAGKTRSSQFMLNTLAVAAAAIRPSQSTIGHTPTHTDCPLGPTTNMGNSSPITEAPAASSRPRQEHRCFVCHRTYERADHLNRHLKSRKRTLAILQWDRNAYV